MRLHIWLVALSILISGLAGVPAPGQVPANVDADSFNNRDDPARQEREPFQIFDNLYYVGIDWVAAYLLVTDQGLILLDSLYGDFVGDLLTRVERLGFEPNDIEYVLVTHGHFDHAGGAEKVHDLTGARVGMTEADWQMVESGTRTGRPMEPFESDLVLRDGDTLTLGDTTITFYVTPGHTLGVLSMAFEVRDGESTYGAFVFGGVGLNFSGVERTETYIASVERIQGFEGLDVNIPNHAFMGRVFERAEALARRQPGEPHPFVDPDGYAEKLEALLVNAREKLEEEKAAAEGS